MDLLTILVSGYFISSLADKWESESFADDDYDDYDDCDEYDDFDEYDY